ncbi:uncharacterized protein EKO05_0005250 [Ascochyta rabiei]|uniref:uncharacterized protein n=1 Tax=Didymella rabiei TaxID=5454 RepID=UPI00220F40F3|nr:uncharacterized protein EKO05_0005250 [Ascochyta rabiei]UPX14778.1 hypothetical protein EKO05_0005250 [Ascochyta rabiei]
MVYRGKPSSACGECRKRRSRCDQASPCGQCVKAGRVCPGYRNAIDLLFHDESAKVIRKSKGQLSKSTSVSAASGKVAVRTHPTSIDLNNIVVYQPWEDLGINFFMSNYVGTDPAVSQLHYLPNYYSRFGYATSALKRTIIASGLAGYARTTRRADLIEKSTKTYTAAIKDINITLSSPLDAVQDTTLMSIMMAAMFETMLVSQDSGMHNVSKHLEGAMLVASLSLQHQKPSHVFNALLSTLVQSVIMNSWIQHVPLPPRYKLIRSHVPEKINPHSVHAKLVAVLAQVIEFRDDLKSGLCSNPEVILQRALEVDVALKTFVEEMPNHTSYEKCWIPTMQATEVQQLVYNCVFHVYPQQFAGHLWNNVRSCRVYLHQLIHQQCSKLLSSTGESEFTNLRLQRSASESLSTLIAEEICATVPQLLSYSDYLRQFVESTEYALSVPTEDSGSNVSTPDTFNASSPNSTSTKSSYASNKDIPKDYTSKVPLFTPGALDPASAFHLLLKLHNLTSIPWLPFAMKSWITGRISWIETNSDPYSAARLKAMIRKRPADGFPVSDAPGQVPYGGICQTIATTPADQRLWFLAHSWLFVGIDWNADYYSEASSASSKDHPSEVWLEQHQRSEARQSSRDAAYMPMDEIISSSTTRTKAPVTLAWRKPHWTV